MPRQPTKPFVPTGIVGKNLLALIEAYAEEMDGPVSVNAWSKAVGVTQTTINRILRDDLSPTEDLIVKLATQIGCRPWQLMAPNLGLGLSRPREAGIGQTDEASQIGTNFPQDEPASTTGGDSWKRSQRGREREEETPPRERRRNSPQMPKRKGAKS